MAGKPVRLRYDLAHAGTNVLRCKMIYNWQMCFCSPAHAAQTILDHAGARAPRCCALRNGLLVVCRDEGLYDYTLDTRAGCTVFEGRKQQLAVLRRFLVVVGDALLPAGQACDLKVRSSNWHDITWHGVQHSAIHYVLCKQHWPRQENLSVSAAQTIIFAPRLPVRSRARRARWAC